MTDATTAFRNVTLPNGRGVNHGSRRRPVRRLVRSLCLCVGSIAVACALFAAILAAAAWLVRSTISNHPYLQARAAFAVATAGPTDRHPGLTATNRPADAPRMPQIAIESTVALNAMIFAAKAAAATTATFTPRVAMALPAPIAPQRDEATASQPIAQHDDQDNLTGVPDAIRVAALMPVTISASAPSTQPPEFDADETTAMPPPRPQPAKRAAVRSPPEVKVAALTTEAITTGSIPDASNLREREDKAPPRPLSRERVAVYDIAASTVYMPNGERLEAHSGLGHRRDDPRHIRVKNQGPTPPNIYDLTMREQLFHGVRAIRLNPVDQAKMYGRDGMLAHTYLLGPNGQSNGCVSFKDYPRFLRAFQRGEVDRLVVVPSLANVSWRTVAARGRSGRRYADLSL